MIEINWTKENEDVKNFCLVLLQSQLMFSKLTTAQQNKALELVDKLIPDEPEVSDGRAS